MWTKRHKYEGKENVNVVFTSVIEARVSPPVRQRTFLRVVFLFGSRARPHPPTPSRQERIQHPAGPRSMGLPAGLTGSGLNISPDPNTIPDF